MCIGEIHIITSGAFAEALNRLAPDYEKQSDFKIKISYGSSMGGALDSIPARLKRNEKFDIVILAASSIEDFIQSGLVKAETRIDLVASVIGAVVKAGSTKPDISTVDALKQTLLCAKSVAYSASASGTYMSTCLFPRLGIADEMSMKAKKVFSERVGLVVARGDAEIGFQQVSELITIPGIDHLGEIPAEVQHTTIFSAGIMHNVTNIDASKDFLKFLASPSVAPIIQNAGLKPALPAIL